MKPTKIGLDDKPVETPMSYTTYIYLRDLIKKGQEDLHRDFLVAHDFIPPQSSKDIRKKLVSARQIATEIYREKDKVFWNMLKELHSAARASNKKHPNKEMRKFWGVEE